MSDTLSARLRALADRLYNIHAYMSNDLEACATAAENLERDKDNLKQVALDLHAALGVEWGSDPYAAISALKAENERANARYIGECERYQQASDENERLRKERDFLLSSSCFLQLNANDVFGYATAYSVSFDADDLPRLLDLVGRFGQSGITAWMAKEEALDVIPPLRTPEYKAARRALGEEEGR